MSPCRPWPLWSGIETCPRMTFPLPMVTRLPTLAREEQPRVGGQRRPSAGRGSAQHEVSALGARLSQGFVRDLSSGCGSSCPRGPAEAPLWCAWKAGGRGAGAAGVMRGAGPRAESADTWIGVSFSVCWRLVALVPTLWSAPHGLLKVVSGI